MKTFLLITTCVVFSIQMNGQSKIDSKLYTKDLKIANVFFETEDYLKAIYQYQKVLTIDPNHEIANLNTLICRLKLNQAIDSCIYNLSRLKNSKIPEVQFYQGKINHLSSNFDEAIKNYNAYKNIPNKKRRINNEEVNYAILCSKNALMLINQPHRSVIKNIGNTINSCYSEYVPLITPDENILYFTSRREGGIGNLKDAYGNYYEDVYISQKTEDGKWSSPKNIGYPVNTNTHDACVALSFDGNQLIIYRTSDDLITGDLYLSKMGQTGWEIPVKFGSEINTPFIETSACFSSDTSVIYFSSNKPGGFGGKDIYRIKKTPNGKWSIPMNLGAIINTDKDEDSPFLNAQGTTLYFSSKGHNSMGEYDVFKTSLNDTSYSAPENLGFPINSVNNDIFFVLNSSGTHGYYSSVRKETFGGSDIYMIDTRFGDNDVKVKEGQVMFGSEINKAKITIIDIETKQVVGIYNANSKTGKFIIAINPLKCYKAIIEEEGFETITLDIQPIVNELTERVLIINLTKKK